MSHAARSMFRNFAVSFSYATLAILLSAACLSGCATASEQLAYKLKPGEAMGRVYHAKYEEVESALKMAMMKYPQRIDNTEAGIFETDYVKGEARFKPAHAPTEYTSGYRYRIIVRLARGRADDRSAVKVQIVKQIELARDFFADPDMLSSDGLEESVILYRIGREITIARAIQKTSASSSGASTVSDDLPADIPRQAK